MAAAGPSRAGRSTLERDGSEHSDGQLTLAGLAAGSSKAASKSKANQPDPKGKQRAAQTRKPPKRLRGARRSDEEFIDDGDPNPVPADNVDEDDDEPAPNKPKGKTGTKPSLGMTSQPMQELLSDWMEGKGIPENMALSSQASYLGARQVAAQFSRLQRLDRQLDQQDKILANEIDVGLVNGYSLQEQLQLRAQTDPKAGRLLERLHAVNRRLEQRAVSMEERSGEGAEGTSKVGTVDMTAEDSP